MCDWQLLIVFDRTTYNIKNPATSAASTYMKLMDF